MILNSLPLVCVPRFSHSPLLDSPPVVSGSFVVQQGLSTRAN